MFVDTQAPVPAAPKRRWTFGTCAFDEASWLFTCDGKPVELEGKPIEILLVLLHHAGEVVTKDELLETVWPGLAVVEGSLTTAISKLRRAMGEDAALVETVPRIGYRLRGAVSAQVLRPDRPDALLIELGSVVPDRANWRFAERLDLSHGSEVWRIEHVRTHESRVLKFAVDSQRLRALKRESAISRLLGRSLGARPDFVAVLDWNFATPPLWLESAYGGPDLNRWAAARQGLGSLPLAIRLELIASIADTIAAAHGVGVLHKDLKPGNILIDTAADGRLQPRVVDFGSAALTDAQMLAALDITRTGFGPPDGESAEPSGTPVWMAPELLAGDAGSVRSDIYALGVMLYQIVVGDLRRPLSAGWEAGIADPLLREDIALAASGDPSCRLDSAAELARRLRALETRRSEHDALAEARRRARIAESRLERVRARRPWVFAAAAILLAGVSATAMLYAHALRDRDIARRQTAISEQVRGFLASDLLGRSSPFQGGSAGESLVDAVRRVAPQIDLRFRNEPAIAASLHQTIARALDQRSDWAGGRAEYDRAASLWALAEGSDSADALATRLQAALMEARSYTQGSLQRAQATIAAAEARIAAQHLSRPDLTVWLASAKSMVALTGNDIRTAANEFARAVQVGDGWPGFDPSARLTLRQRLAFTRIRLGDGAGAERLFRDLQTQYAAIEGPDGPYGLLVGLNLAQALMVQGRYEAAVAQANLVYPRLLTRLGEDNEMTLQLLSTRAQSEGALGRWDDTVRDDLHVHDIAIRKQGPKSFFAIATLSDAATAQCRAGAIAEGTAHAETAHRFAAEGFAGSALDAATGFTLAACQIAAARYDEALSHLGGIDRAAVAQLTGDPDWGANVDLALAEIALAQGRRADARRLVDATRAAFTRQGAEPYQVRRWHRLDDQLR